MPLTVTRLVRKFKYGSVSLPDPDPTKTPEQVMEHFASTLYADLTNGDVKGPVIEGNAEVFTFVRSIGDKG